MIMYGGHGKSDDKMSSIMKGVHGMLGVWELNWVMINQGVYLINLVRIGAPTLNHETLCAWKHLVYGPKWFIRVMVNQEQILINLVRMAMPKLNYETIYEDAWYVDQWERRELIQCIGQKSKAHTRWLYEFSKIVGLA